MSLPGERLLSQTGGALRLFSLLLEAQQSIAESFKQMEAANRGLKMLFWRGFVQ